MPQGSNGLPDPTQRQTFASGAADAGRPRDRAERRPLLRRHRHGHDPGDQVRRRGNNRRSPSRRPRRRAATRRLTVNFDGSGSSDPDAGDTISYSWDLNGDGTFGDSTVAEAVVHLLGPRDLQRSPEGDRQPGASTTSSPDHDHGRSPAGARRSARRPPVRWTERHRRISRRSRSTRRRRRATCSS